ncbi:MAG TPA: hypothetical protein VEK56_14955 [Vicinamibacterales bacterium]|nr:hypothetical protein [Vicinamibacterales bacterium]
MDRARLVCAAALAMLLIGPREAAADITAFIGVTPTPEMHAVQGFALGVGLLIVGFEFEYAHAAEDTVDELPSLHTGSANVFVQTPVEIHRLKFYGTTGVGFYRERLVLRQETHYANNVGGGVKIRLAGPLRLRIDYRVFQLHGNPLFSTYQRVYVGANLSF